MSEKQRADAEGFLLIYPSERDVLAFFAPVKWAAAVAHAGKCMAYPHMTLQLLDLTYTEGISAQLVENNIRGIFTFIKSGEPLTL